MQIIPLGHRWNNSYYKLGPRNAPVMSSRVDNTTLRRIMTFPPADELTTLCVNVPDTGVRAGDRRELSTISIMCIRINLKTSNYGLPLYLYIGWNSKLGVIFYTESNQKLRGRLCVCLSDIFPLHLVTTIVSAQHAYNQSNN